MIFFWLLAKWFVADITEKRCGHYIFGRSFLTMFITTFMEILCEKCSLAIVGGGSLINLHDLQSLFGNFDFTVTIGFSN